jgi:hypothetical protein
MVGLYAHIEFLLADLCEKVWARPDYASLRAVFPYRMETRIAEVRKIFSYDGPLKQYQAPVEALLSRLQDYEEMRHFMAHGVMLIDYSSSQVEMRLYRPTKGGRVEIRTKIFSDIHQLENVTAEIAQFADDWVRLLLQIDTAAGTVVR